MNSNRLNRTVPVLAAVALALAVFAGCGGDPNAGPDDTGTGGTGATGGTGGIDNTGGTGGDGGTGGAGGGTGGTGGVEKCVEDQDCGRNLGLRCDEATGDCVQGEECDADYSCGFGENGGYCGDDESNACVCVDDTTSQFGGICWRRFDSCEPCATDADCGSSDMWDDPRECVTYNYDGEQVNVCLPKKRASGCIGGFVTGVDEYAGYCVPQSGDCVDNPPCANNDDCTNPAFPVCNETTGVCGVGCTFDYQADKSLNCAAGKVCHVIEKNLDPTLYNDCSTIGSYGAGECGVECDADNDCDKYENGGGIDLVCVLDGNENRCRPAKEEGSCIDDQECSVAGSEGRLYLGYCDVTTRECIYDNCRVGPDPRNGCNSNVPYEDCDPEYKCVESDVLPIGIGECVKKNCIDKGGASEGCPVGWFCAGEQKIDKITGETTNEIRPIPDGTPIGACYAPPEGSSTWCEKGCGANSECGSGGPSANEYEDTPGQCLPLGMATICQWGCEYAADCPGRWNCSSAGLEAECGDNAGLKVCFTDIDCGGRAGSCVDPLANGRDTAWPAGVAPFKVCACEDDTQCGPGDTFTCNAGIGTAGVDPGTPETYMKPAARYCAKNDACGTSGSCEWFNLWQPRMGQPPIPRFVCGATLADEGEWPVESTCPPEFDGSAVRQGKAVQDMLMCVTSSVCRPTLYTEIDPESPNFGDQFCFAP